MNQNYWKENRIPEPASNIIFRVYFANRIRNACIYIYSIVLFESLKWFRE